MTEGLGRPRLHAGYVFDPNVEKLYQEALQCLWDGGEWLSALYDYTCSGQLCGGPAGIKCDCYM